GPRRRDERGGGPLRAGDPDHRGPPLAGRERVAGRHLPRGRARRRSAGRRSGRGADRARVRAHRDARAGARPRRAAGGRRLARLPGPGGAAVIRVALVDDQTLVRQGIRSLLTLADDVEVVAEAGDGRAALDVIAEHRPDVVLLDLRMPVLDGIGTLRELAGAAHVPAVLVLTTFDDDEAVLAALRSGARGYLLKDVTLEGLLEAIRT